MALACATDRDHHLALLLQGRDDTLKLDKLKLQAQAKWSNVVEAYNVVQSMKVRWTNEYDYCDDADDGRIRFYATKYHQRSRDFSAQILQLNSDTSSMTWCLRCDVSNEGNVEYILLATKKVHFFFKSVMMRLRYGMGC